MTLVAPLLGTNYTETLHICSKASYSMLTVRLETQEQPKRKMATTSMK